MQSKCDKILFRAFPLDYFAPHAPSHAFTLLRENEPNALLNCTKQRGNAPLEKRGRRLEREKMFSTIR